MSFQCPHCQRISHNPMDEEHRYCASCHRFWDGMTHKEKVISNLSPEARKELARIQRKIDNIDRLQAVVNEPATGMIVSAIVVYGAYKILEWIWHLIEGVVK